MWSGAVASVVCAQLVDGPACGLHVAHRSSLACHLADETGRVVICLVTHGALRLPHAILVNRLPDPTTARVTVGSGRIAWERASVAVTRWWLPARPVLPALGFLLSDQEAAAFAHDWSMTIGRGEGLTPYDDDVVCGGLATLWAAGHPAAIDVAAELRREDLERRTTPVSAALLRLAADGWCLTQLAGYLRERAQGVVDGPSAQLLQQVGHSSGHGLIAGVSRLLTDSAAPGSRCGSRRTSDATRGELAA